MRNKFSTREEMKRAVKRLDERLGKIYADLYHWTIQWGAHPEREGRDPGYGGRRDRVTTQIYLQADGYQLDLWLRTANHVGIPVPAENIRNACIMRGFEKLNVCARIDGLARGLQAAEKPHS